MKSIYSQIFEKFRIKRFGAIEFQDGLGCKIGNAVKDRIITNIYEEVWILLSRHHYFFDYKEQKFFLR